MWAVWALLFGLALAGDEPLTAAERTHDLMTSMADLQASAALVKRLERTLIVYEGPLKLTLRGGYVVPIFSGHFAGTWEDKGEEILRRQRVLGDRSKMRIPDAEARGSKELVGIVWVDGNGSADLTLRDRADAMILANHLVRDLGEDKRSLEAFAHGEQPLRSGLRRAVLLSQDPQFQRLFLADPDDDPFEVTVYGDDPRIKAAGLRAADLFQSRKRTWRRSDIQAGRRIAWDRVAAVRGVDAAGATFAIVDAETGRHFGNPVMPRNLAPNADDRWMTVIRDQTGGTDERRSHQVLALGSLGTFDRPGSILGGLPFPPSDRDDASSARRPPIYVEPIDAITVVTLQRTQHNGRVHVTVESKLTYRARGGPIQWIDVFVPQSRPVQGHWHIIHARLPDGTPLLGAPPVLPNEVLASRRVAPAPPTDPPTPLPPRDRSTNDAGDRNRNPPETPPRKPVEDPTRDPLSPRLRLILPTPLSAGESVTVELAYKDAWQISNFPVYFRIPRSMGTTSGLRYYLPEPRYSLPGAPVRYRTTVKIPEKESLTPVVGGDTKHDVVIDGWRTIVTTDSGGAAAWPAVAVGDYRDYVDPPGAGLPSVGAYMLTTGVGTIRDIPPEIRRIMHYYEGWLPKLPLSHVKMFEQERMLGGYRWVAPHGMAASTTTETISRTARQVFGADPSTITSNVMAHEIAHQYWGHLAQPASGDDFWIAETFAELYSCVYSGAAWGSREYKRRMAAKRLYWEGEPERPLKPSFRATLSRAYDSGVQPKIVYDWGPWLFARALQSRIGTEAMFSALDAIIRNHPHQPVTSERLLMYLEATSEQELDDFFDFWVYGGYIPKLNLRVTPTSAGYDALLTSDIPFGRFDVTVRGHHRQTDQWTEFRMDVIDGTGRYDLALDPPSGWTFELDPRGHTPARRRKVSMRSH